MTTEEFATKLDLIYAQLRKVLVEKNASYGGESFYGEGFFPIMGNCVRLRDKMSRYTNLVTKLVNGQVDPNSSEMNPFGESIWDTVQDMVGYSLIGLCILDEKGLGKLKSSEEDDETLHLDYLVRKQREKAEEGALS